MELPNVNGWTVRSAAKLYVYPLALQFGPWLWHMHGNEIQEALEASVCRNIGANSGE